jgi:16S rRNA (guanine966-N2)-methyltransferase
MQNNAETPTITAGFLKGRKLQIPKGIRPFTGMVKRVLFDTLSDVIEGAEVLDLFSGSGSIGFEALSRGAKHVTCVDESFDAKKVFEMNKLRILNSENIGGIEFIESDYQKFIKKKGEMGNGKYDLVIIDPPFPLFERMNLRNIEGILSPGALIVLKAPKRVKESNLSKIFGREMETIKIKEVGVNVLYFLRIKS